MTYRLMTWMTNRGELVTAQFPLYAVALAEKDGWVKVPCWVRCVGVGRT